MSTGVQELPAIARAESPDAGQQARRVGARRKLGRVDVHADAAAAEAPWAQLEAACPGSIYQTRRFLLPWLATFGVEDRITPMIVVAHDALGDPVALLPFGIVRRGPFRIAGFLGGDDSNSNTGLYRPDVEFSPADLESLLRAAAAKAAPKPDLFLLTNQPEHYEGAKNPLDIFPHQLSASFCHSGALAADPKAFIAERLSKDTAKKLRKKAKRLEGMGAVAHIVARTPAQVARILDVFYALKLERFRQKHIASDFERPISRSFLERACSDGLEAGAPAIELHALTLDDRIVAIFAGGAHRDHLHLMFNAFDMDVEIAKSSPGDLLLQRILERKCSEGLRSFDLGVGEARYKTTWCDHAERMFDSVLAITARGRAFSAAESSRRHLKRWIKQSDWAWPLAQRLMRRA